MFRFSPNDLRLFENNGIATLWQLDLPLTPTTSTSPTLLDVQLVLSFDGVLRPGARVATVLAALPPRAATRAAPPRCGCRPRRAVLPAQPGQRRPHRSTPSDFPLLPARPRPDRCARSGSTGTGALMNGLVAAPRRGAGARSRSTLGADGTLGDTAPGSPLAALVDDPVPGDWTISRPGGRQPGQWSDGEGNLDLEGLQDVQVFQEYGFDVPLTWPASGTEPSAVAPPAGTGFAPGLGEAFTINLSTGQGGYSVPLPLPAASPATSRELRLEYRQGPANGPFGLGWRLPLRAIERRLDFGPDGSGPLHGRRCGAAGDRRRGASARGSRAAFHRYSPDGRRLAGRGAGTVSGHRLGTTPAARVADPDHPRASDAPGCSSAPRIRRATRSTTRGRSTAGRRTWPPCATRSTRCGSSTSRARTCNATAAPASCGRCAGAARAWRST